MGDNKLTNVDDDKVKDKNNMSKEKSNSNPPKDYEVISDNIDNSKRLFRFLKDLDYEKINEVMKFITTIGAIIVSFLTLYLEVKRKRLATEVSNYFNLPRHYFMVTSNKVLLNLYNLLVYGLFLYVFLTPLILIVVYKDKKIRNSELNFYLIIIYIMYSIIITIGLSLTDIPLLKHLNLYTIGLMLVLFLLCKRIMKNLIIKYVGVIDGKGNDIGKESNKSRSNLIKSIKDFFDKKIFM